LNKQDPSQTKRSQQTERLQKFIAHAGIASRRKAEKMIAQGRVQVNGLTITEMGVKIDPKKDAVTVDGRPVRPSQQSPIYIVLNKPRNVLSTTKSQDGRRTVLDFVDVSERLYPIGRLDYPSEGLILLSNDGELAQKLTHPAYGHEREYVVLLNEPLTRDKLRQWRAGGFEVDGKAVRPMKVVPYASNGPNWYRLTLTEGRKRQIRVVADQLGYQVNTLIRIRFGPLKLGKLRPGAWRYLNNREVERLKRPGHWKKVNHKL
jgi:23S rRNA pseudouridine2605 synthase